MRKVIFITGSMVRGGAERVISNLCNYFADAGWDVCLISCLHPETGYYIDSRIRIADVSAPRRNRLLDLPRLIAALRSIIRNEQPDAVVSFMYKINIITAVACKGLRVRFYPSERNDPDHRSWILKKAGEWAYGQATMAIMQTTRAKSCFSTKVQRKSIVIPNPVSVEEYATDQKRKEIVTVGRLEPQKNQKLLIEAFYLFRQTHPDYKLHIFGTGSLERELKGQVVRLGLQDAVEFKGNVENIHYQIREAALFVLSSDYEGLSNALLEAMMMGLPCISTDCLGSDDIIDDGESGIIVGRGDVYALAAAMHKLIDDQGLAKAYAAEAHRRTVARYSAKETCQQWERVIEA